MANKWNIPKELEEKIRKRDKSCVYCHKEFKNTHKDRVTWEHIDNNEKNISEENIVLCCGSCNSSKGTKSLKEWLDSDYCKKLGINKDNISVK
jgi:5-methylcytosine-specific restriction endonuclease McrA